MNVPRTFAFILLALVPFTDGPGVQAQEEPEYGSGSVDCTSTIYLPLSSPPEGYVQTTLDGAAAFYYDVSTSADFNGNPELGVDGDITAGTAPAPYLLYGYHYLSAAVSFTQDGTTCNEDGLFLFNQASDSPQYQHATISGTGNGTYQCVAPEVLLAVTYDQADDVGISSISPASVPLGGSGTMTILMSSFAGCNDTNPTITVTPPAGVPSGTGLKVSVGSVTCDTEVDAPYSVDTNQTSVGTYGITVTTSAGTSNSVGVTVYDPTPSISVSPPSPWQAAKSPLTVTVSGTGLGTNPQLNITGSGVTGFSVVGQPTGSPITASVYLNPGGGTAAITVTYGGTGGPGFLPAPGGSATSNEVDEQVAPLPPNPTIVWGSGAGACANGTNVAGTIQSVVIGQQIALVGCVPSGVQAQSESWSPVSQGTIVAGYTASTNSAVLQQVAPTTCTAGQNCPLAPFYWVDEDQTGDRVATFTYTPSGGQPLSAQVPFSVGGPSNVSVGAPMNPVTIQPGVAPYIDQPPYIALGSPTQIGIAFNGSATSPTGTPGQFTWVQLVNTFNIKFLTSNAGTQVCTLPPFSVSIVGPNPPALDTSFPYPANGLYTNDNPKYWLSAT